MDNFGNIDLDKLIEGFNLMTNQLLSIGLFHEGLQDMTVIREGVGHGWLRIMEAPNAVNFMKLRCLGCFHSR